jgi:hypothetical protein
MPQLPGKSPASYTDLNPGSIFFSQANLSASISVELQAAPAPHHTPHDISLRLEFELNHYLHL